MSGDVQPRKRKDKKKKKDDLGIEEPRGTAAALGEGDIFMHSQHEHGTGGHWCAKVIFFSLLAVLVTLIGLIILENRGLSELEANSVESRYSGVLEGWLEDGHDGDHHDEHTLELNHHDDEEDDDDHGSEFDHDDEDEEREHDDDEEDETHDDEDENHEDDDDEDDDENDEQDDVDQEENVDEDSREPNDDNDGNENSEQEDLETAEDEDEVEERNYRRYYQRSKAQANDEDDDDDDGSDDLQKVDDNDDNDQSAHSDDDDEVNERGNDDSQENDDGDDENDERGNGDSQENDDDDDGEQDQLDTNEDDDENSDENDEHNEDEEHDDHVEEDLDVEVEHIEQEVFDDDVSNEAPASDLDDKSEEASNEFNPVDEADEEEVEFLEADDLDELPEEMPIPVSKGKPLAEVEEISSERPQDTLADEEEYERQQDALRKEKEQTSQGMWLKLVVGGALLVATQAVLRRATAPRESDEDVDTTREETPLSDRRMTLISEPVPPPLVTPKPQEITRPIVQKEVVRQAPMVQSSPPPPEEIDDEVEEEEDEEDHFITEKLVAAKKEIDKELYSDEEEAEDEEEQAGVVEERKEAPTVSKPTAPIKVLPKPAPVKETPKSVEKKESPKPAEKEPTPEEDDDDVEIIEDEDLGEELEEEEEDISDVDDAELLNRLEAKYGRLPEPERPGGKKDGGNSIDDEWPGEPSDAYWRNELDQAERDLRQGEWTRAVERASADKLRPSARARYIIARALDLAAEAKRDNNLLTKAIASYLELLKMNERLSDVKLIEVTDRTLNRIKFRGNYLGAEPVYRLLIRRFPDDPTHRNNLTVSFLMANRVDLAEEVIKETLTRWPNDRVALAHHGFILKTLHNRLEEAVDAFTNALEGDTGPANEPRFYYHLGDSLLLLGRFKEAHEVHKRGAKLGHFLSPAQRSLYNVDRLKSKPWWDIERTPYTRLARALEKSWKEILKEGLAAQALYEKEKEGLKERGEWSQLDLFVQGREVPNRCSRAPVTCNIVRSEVAASGCRRGQVKFSSMEAGTHVRPHVGPTNCRLRMHLGLSNTKDTFLRVDQEIRQWQTGKVLVFDDSFEHEVWHNGTGTRLVLIVDVWHPDLTPNERRQLPAI